MEIYIVMGTSGEYSDRNEWPVIAYFNEDKAKEHVENAGKRAKEIYATHDHIPYWRIPPKLNEFDPEMQLDYTGTTYYYYTVELGDTNE